MPTDKSTECVGASGDRPDTAADALRCNSGATLQSKPTPRLITVSLSREAISRLAGLCDARVHALRKFAAENAGKLDEEDDVADADNDASYLAAVAIALRSARDA